MEKDYLFRGQHKVTFSLDHGPECTGYSVLTTEDELGNKIKYGLSVHYRSGERGEGCPYGIQLNFGAMEEDSLTTYTELTVYEMNDFRKAKTFKGVIEKD